MAIEGGRLEHRRVFLPLVFGLVALAWLTLWWWGRSPHAGYLHHDHLRLDLEVLAVAVAGWTVMTAAMMLPTALPLLLVFQRMTARRHSAGRLVAMVVVGYLAVWTLGGVVLHVGDRVVHTAVESLGGLRDREWVVGVAALSVAGAYQFSALKYRCLDQCRSPQMFVMSRWTGPTPGRDALRIGLAHGAFCVGCCWSLMLLMFAVGVGNLGWMLVLGAVMAVEKNSQWGRRLARPLGVVLLAIALVVTGANLATGGGGPGHDHEHHHPA